MGAGTSPTGGAAFAGTLVFVLAAIAAAFAASTALEAISPSRGVRVQGWWLACVSVKEEVEVGVTGSRFRMLVLN